MAKGGFVKGTDSGLVSDSGFFDCGRYKFVARSRLVSILFWTDYNDPFVVVFQWLQRYASIDRKAANNWCSCSSGGCRGCDHQRPIARSFTFLYFSNNNTHGWFLSHVAVLHPLSNQHKTDPPKDEDVIHLSNTNNLHSTWYFFCYFIFFLCRIRRPDPISTVKLRHWTLSSIQFNVHLFSKGMPLIRGAWGWGCAKSLADESFYRFVYIHIRPRTELSTNSAPPLFAMFFFWFRRWFVNSSNHRFGCFYAMIVQMNSRFNSSIQHWYPVQMKPFFLFVVVIRNSSI